MSEEEIRRLVVTFAGNTSALTTSMNEVSELVSSTEQELDQFKDRLQDSISEASVAVGDIITPIEEVKESIEAVADSTEIVSSEAIAEASDSLKELSTDAIEAAKSSEDLGAVQSSAAESTEDLARSLLESMPSYKKMVQSLEEYKEAVEGASEEQEENFEPSLQQMLHAINALPGPLGPLITRFISLEMTLKSVYVVLGPLIPLLLALSATIAMIAAPFVILDKVTKNSIASLEKLDRTVKKATSLGESVENLQALSFALGEIAGLDASRTEMLLLRLQNTIGGIVQGQGRSNVFKDLGLDLQKVVNLSPAEQFKTIAEAIGGIESKALKTRIAMQLFGREGMTVVGALEAQAEVIAESEAFAKMAGLTISEEQAKATEAANDAMARLTQISEGWVNQIAVNLAPLFTAISNELLDWGIYAGSFDLQLRVATDTLVTMFGIAVDTAQVVKGIFEILFSRDFESVGEGWATVMGGISGENTSALMERLNSERQAAADAIGNHSKNLNLENEALKQVNSSAAEYLESLKEEVLFLGQSENGIQSKRAFDLYRKGGDVELVQEIIAAELELEAIKQAKQKRQQEIEQQRKISAQQEQRDLSRAAMLLESILTPQEQILNKALEIQDLMGKGLIPEDAGLEMFDRLQDELDNVTGQVQEMTQQAGVFWRVLSGTDTRFGVGREGFKSALQDLRADAYMSLDPTLNVNEARSIVMSESSRENKTEVEGKLLTVLELLEQHLNKPENPNKDSLPIVSDWS